MSGRYGWPQSTTEPHTSKYFPCFLVSLMSSFCHLYMSSSYPYCSVILSYCSCWPVSKFCTHVHHETRSPTDNQNIRQQHTCQTDQSHANDVAYGIPSDYLNWVHLCTIFSSENTLILTEMGTFYFSNIITIYKAI